MTITTLAVLATALDRISVPERWARGEYALSKDRESVWPDAPDAVAWCWLGAVDKAIASLCGHRVWDENLVP